jgi:hypothetical protein
MLLACVACVCVCVSCARAVEKRYLNPGAGEGVEPGVGAGQEVLGEGLEAPRYDFSRAPLWREDSMMCMHRSPASLMPFSVITHLHHHHHHHHLVSVFHIFDRKTTNYGMLRRRPMGRRGGLLPLF